LMLGIAITGNERRSNGDGSAMNKTDTIKPVTPAKAGANSLHSATIANRTE
jgi:hypothetical protein